MPTTEFSSPTATSAVNENRRPPLTTLATRLISITRSCRSRPCGLTVSAVVFIGSLQGSGSELQAPFAGALGQSPDLAVIAVSAAVEDARLDPRLLGALGEQLAAALRPLHRLQGAKLLLGPVHGHHGATGRVIDQLREQAAVGAIDRKPGAFGAPADLRPHAAAAAQAALLLGEDRHRNALTLAFRPCGARAPRRSGSPCPCRARAGAACGSAPRSRRRAACRSPGRSPRWAAGPRTRCPREPGSRRDASNRAPARAPCPADGRGSRHPGSRGASRSRW